MGIPVVAADVCRVMIQMIVDNAAALSADPDLVLSGLSYRTDAHAADDEDTSPYEYIKDGDRLAVPPGLTICVLPLEGVEGEAFSGYGVDTNFRVDLIAYMRDVDDPQKLSYARDGVTRSLLTFFNDSARYIISTPNGPFYQCRIFRHQYVLAWKPQINQYVPAVRFWWRGMATYVA